MRIVFAGTPHFAERALSRLLDAKKDVVLVLTQPDRKSGRGMKVVPSPVKTLALRHGLAVYQPLTLSDPAAIDRLRSASADILVVAAYGLILPQVALDLPRLGGINIHASLLPRWRGAAPIQRAILAGDQRTGISIMQMDAGLDTGDILAQSEVSISDEDTTLTLHDKLAILGADMILAALEGIARGCVRASAQPLEGLTYAGKVGKEEAWLDWRRSCTELDRAVRAFNPSPGAHAMLSDTAVKIWKARPAEGRGEPGRVVRAGDDGIQVACGEGALILLELQRAGAKRLFAREFLQGHPLATGDRFTLLS